MASHRNTIMVTGGLGFIGSHVVEDILATTNQNVVIVDFNENSPNVPLFATDSRVTILYEDITSPEEVLHDVLQPFQAQVHTCIHLAAAISVEESMTNPEKYQRNNVEGSRAIFKWCIQHGCTSVVAASSAAVYGDPVSLPCRETDVSSKSSFLSPYARTKFEMEMVGRELVAEYTEEEEEEKTHFVFLRFFNVYGPRQDPRNPYTGVISKFMDFAMRGQPITIFGNGEQTRDFVFVKDISNAILRSAEKAPELDTANVYNVCTGRRCSVKELAGYCIALPGSHSESISYRPPRAGDIVHSWGDNTSLVHEVGWDYASSLSDGLAKTWFWFKKNEKMAKAEEVAPGTEVSARAGVGIA